MAEPRSLLLRGERRPAGRKQGRGKGGVGERRRVTDGEAVKWTCVSSPPSGPQSGDEGAASCRAALSGILTGWLMDPRCACCSADLLYLGAKEESPGCILLEACWRQGVPGIQDAGLPALEPQGPLGGPHLFGTVAAVDPETCPRPQHPQGSFMEPPQHRGP